jgi:hypothetical protein
VFKRSKGAYTQQVRFYTTAPLHWVYMYGCTAVTQVRISHLEGVLKSMLEGLYQHRVRVFDVEPHKLLHRTQKLHHFREIGVAPVHLSSHKTALVLASLRNMQACTDHTNEVQHPVLRVRTERRDQNRHNKRDGLCNGEVAADVGVHNTAQTCPHEPQVRHPL